MACNPSILVYLMDHPDSLTVSIFIIWEWYNAMHKIDKPRVVHKFSNVI